MNTSDYILSLADRCVKCGLCLPQCPTYALTANENESPRGRIALVQGWLTGELSPSDTLTQHLDQCLLCRRCERICPSVVPYGEIMDQSKALLIKESKVRISPHSIVSNSSLNLLLNKKFSGYFILILRLLQKSGFLLVLKKIGLLKIIGLQRLVSYLPKLDKPIKTKSYYPADSSNIDQQDPKNVALFSGCVSKQLDPKAVEASIKLLNRLGYGVYVPEQQMCCGALHLHKGNKKQAVKFANNNVKLFNQQKDISAIVSLVNGCSSQLQEYPQLKTSDSFTPVVKDIIEFLSEAQWPENIEFETLDEDVALQIPCSLQNMLRAEDKLMALLLKIPGIKLPPHTIYNKCCGAAGTYFVQFPEFSDQLKDLALKTLKQSSPKLIISSNLGCALQLKSGLAHKKPQIEVIHPVLLLQRQLKSN